MNRLFTSALALAFLTATVAAEVRTWTDATGRAITAELLDATASSVTIERNGKTYDLPLAKLSAADVAFVKDWLSKNAERDAAMAAEAAARQMVFGGVTFEAGKRAQFNLKLTPELAQDATKAAEEEIAEAVVSIALPAEFDPAKPQRVLVVSATSSGSGLSVAHMNAYVDLATGRNWVVVAADNVDGQPEDDNSRFRYALLQAAFAEMKARWPAFDQFSFACGGNSGGAKHSGYVAAQMIRDQYEVIGIFMGGCNHDTATDSFNYYTVPKREFLEVPIWLSNGLDDKIAGDPWPQRVYDSMESTGFKQVRMERFKGGHQMDKEEAGKALEWFAELRP